MFSSGLFCLAMGESSLHLIYLHKQRAFPFPRNFPGAWSSEDTPRSGPSMARSGEPCNTTAAKFKLRFAVEQLGAESSAVVLSRLRMIEPLKQTRPQSPASVGTPRIPEADDAGCQPHPYLGAARWKWAPSPMPSWRPSSRHFLEPCCSRSPWQHPERAPTRSMPPDWSRFGVPS